MEFILSKEEYDALSPKYNLDKMTICALEASKALAEIVERNEYGWKGCVANGTSEYCSYCPAINWCPYENKRHGK